jgi:putative ABC transport system permease protein
MLWREIFRNKLIYAMIKNFLLVTLRNMIRDKVYLILNLLGLSIGIAGSILILLYVRHELSYDKFHKNADRIYRITCTAKLEGKDLSASVTAPPQARVFMEEYPEIEDATRYYYPYEQKLIYNNITYHEKGFYYADPNFLQIFNFPLVKGNAETALQNPNSVVITTDIARKLFGNEDPMGKSLMLDNGTVFQVTGIAKNPPDNTHFRFDYLASFNTLELSKSELWLSQMLETYIVLRENYAPDTLQLKFVGLMDKYVLPQLEMYIHLKVSNYQEFEAQGNKFAYLLQPLSDMHLDTSYFIGYEKGTDKVYVYFFSIVAIFLLFIACINFMNLATAKYSYRSKEVGLKKVVGSTRNQLIRQFLAESMIVAIIATIIGLTIVEIVLPYFNNFTEKKLEIGYLDHWYAIPSLLAFTLFVGLISGSYPAFYLSSFKPAEILKSRFNNGSGNMRFRSVLVVIQFAITIMLLISTFIVTSQISYIRNKKLGFNKDNILVVRNTGDLGEQSEPFREQLLKLPGIKNASRSWTIPGDAYWTSTFQIQGDSLLKMYSFEIIQGDYDFVRTLQFRIKEGRGFSKDFTTDNQCILINEKAVHDLGLKEPIGTRLTTPNGQGGMDVLEVIGIFDDVNYKTLHQKIEPMMVALNMDRSNGFTIVRLDGNNIQHTVKQIEKTWNGFIPGQAIDYFFLDENFDNLYRSEIRAGRVFGLFALLAVFVACLGLLGLSAFTAEKRTKEIGIRKVHGASIPVILRLLSKEIVVLITVASFIAWPLVYYFMHKWLQKFAYQTRIYLWIFLTASLIGLIIAIGVVVYQSLKVARLNPVEALKYE